MFSMVLFMYEFIGVSGGVDDNLCDVVAKALKSGRNTVTRKNCVNVLIIFCLFFLS